jgi:MoxR-like ATPase
MKSLEPEKSGIRLGQEIRDAVATVIVGKEEAVERLLVALLCRGHVLLDDVPGVGKTTLAKTLAAALGRNFKRIQFTPDLLPSDVIGSMVFDQSRSEFAFRPGPIFSGVLLADEINRATPRTQSALLEAMEERHVTVDGVTHDLPHPFVVIATQNPLESEGTFALPEAQLDRFLLRLRLGYPTRAEEAEIIRRASGVQAQPLPDPVVRLEEIEAAEAARAQIRVGDPVRDYVLDLIEASRRDDRLVFGASPRAAIALFKAAQALALLRGREFVVPDDVKALYSQALAHRVGIDVRARLKNVTAETVLQEILDRVPVPVENDA